MIVLLVFAFLAGAGTALSPCVLPVLPALLSASATGGRRRPLGVVMGLAITLTIIVVGFASLVGGVGLGSGLLRTIAIAVLAIFGMALIVPSIGDRLERPFVWLSRFGPRSAGKGFWSGIGVGAALGAVYAPCAGPVLAAVISVSASQGTNAQLIVIALTYSIGSAAVLLLLALGGYKVMERIRRAGRGPLVQRVLGSVLVATAVLMSFNFDVKFQTAIADKLPRFIVNPTNAIEKSDAVESQLGKLRGKSRFDSEGGASKGQREDSVSKAKIPGVKTPELPVLGAAPELVDTQKWFNTPDRRPLTLKKLRGDVVLVDFWTYTCINCIRTLPSLKTLDRRYGDRGLTIVGVHTPEFSFEEKADNVEQAIADNDLKYPVVQDNNYSTWNAYDNQFWPAKYLIDAKGKVRYTHFGEGEYRETEAAVRALLVEAGESDLGDTKEQRIEQPSNNITPETYLGYERIDRFEPSPIPKGLHTFPNFKGRLPRDQFAYSGRWNILSERAIAVRDARIDGKVRARKVFLVMSSRGKRSRTVQVLLDGKPISAASSGEDVKDGKVTVTHQQLYELVSLSSVEEHRLTLKFAPGVSGFAFTFG